MRSKAFSIAALVLAAGLALSLTDLYKVQQGTLIVYTTPALRDILESLIVPRFRNATGVDVTLVYVSAGEEYNRLRMSGGHPEADVFLHASPLFLEKGYQAGYFLPFSIRNTSVPVNFLSRSVAGGHLWYAFAWSPLAEVYKPALGAPPDLAFINTTFGFPDPLLSNNGIYAVLFFENIDPAAGARALAHTVVQPANARANILGIADGAFEVTLGYEGVTLFYQEKGARVSYDLPLLGGVKYLTPVMFCAGRQFFEAHEDVTGEQLYAHMNDLAEADGWTFGGTIAGHLVGQFPHEKIAGDDIESYIAPGSDKPMRRTDRNGQVCHWILEVHLVDLDRQIGGFFEELLDLGPGPV